MRRQAGWRALDVGQRDVWRRLMEEAQAVAKVSHGETRAQRLGQRIGEARLVSARWMSLRSTVCDSPAVVG